jgi:hypothetical protein
LITPTFHSTLRLPVTAATDSVTSEFTRMFVRLSLMSQGSKLPLAISPLPTPHRARRINRPAPPPRWMPATRRVCEPAIDDSAGPDRSVAGAHHCRAPCGTDCYEREYDQLRDLRREDDTSLPTGVWQSAVKRANWPELEALTTVLLLERSKDLMLAAWLGEAWLHLQALDGLPGSLALIAGLCERCPEHLHPQAEDGDQSWRVIPLEWLVRRYSDVLLTRVPLFGTQQ